MLNATSRVNAIAGRDVFANDWLVSSAVGDDVDAYMTADEMSEAKHKADMDDKMKKMIREILFYALLHAKYLLSCCPVK